MVSEEQKKKLKEAKRVFMHWCDDCNALTYDYYNPCSGYRQEKCQEEKTEWLKKQVNEIMGS